MRYNLLLGLINSYFKPLQSHIPLFPVIKITGNKRCIRTGIFWHGKYQRASLLEALVFTVSGSSLAHGDKFFSCCWMYAYCAIQLALGNSALHGNR